MPIHPQRYTRFEGEKKGRGWRFWRMTITHFRVNLKNIWVIVALILCALGFLIPSIVFLLTPDSEWENTDDHESYPNDKYLESSAVPEIIFLDGHNYEGAPGDNITINFTISNPGNRNHWLDLQTVSYRDKWPISLLIPEKLEKQLWGNEEPDMEKEPRFRSEGEGDYFEMPFNDFHPEIRSGDVLENLQMIVQIPEFAKTDYEASILIAAKFDFSVNVSFVNIKCKEGAKPGPRINNAEIAFQFENSLLTPKVTFVSRYDENNDEDISEFKTKEWIEKNSFLMLDSGNFPDNEKLKVQKGLLIWDYGDAIWSRNRGDFFKVKLGDDENISEFSTGLLNDPGDDPIWGEVSISENILDTLDERFGNQPLVYVVIIESDNGSSQIVGTGSFTERLSIDYDYEEEGFGDDTYETYIKLNFYGILTTLSFYLPVLLVGAIITPKLLAKDKQESSIMLYLSRPIRKMDILLARFLSGNAFISLVTLLPTLFLIIAKIMITAADADYLQDYGFIFLRVVLFAFVIMVFFTSISLFISTFSKGAIIPGVIYVGLMILSKTVSSILYVISRKSWLGYFSIFDNINQLGCWILDFNDPMYFFGLEQYQHGIAVFVIIGLCLGSSYIKISQQEVGE